MSDDWGNSFFDALESHKQETATMSDRMEQAWCKMVADAAWDASSECPLPGSDVIVWAHQQMSALEAKLAAAEAAVPEYMAPSDCPHYKLSESDGLLALRDAWCKGWNECRAEIIEAQTPRYGEKDRQVLEKAEKLIDEIAAAGDSHHE